MVERLCKEVFLDDTATVCMFTDASLTGHALVLTQVRHWQENVPVEEQQHDVEVFSKERNEIGRSWKRKATQLLKLVVTWNIC